jgi:hypothetical protein
MGTVGEGQVARFFEAHHIKPSFKRLGGCEDSLTEERLFEGEVAEGTTVPCVGCRVVVRYRLVHDGLLLLVLVPERVPKVTP